MGSARARARSNSVQLATNAVTLPPIPQGPVQNVNQQNLAAKDDLGATYGSSPEIQPDFGQMLAEQAQKQNDAGLVSAATVPMPAQRKLGSDKALQSEQSSPAQSELEA